MLIVGLGGTLRQGASCERALRVALDEAARCGARTQCFAGDALRMPFYDPTAPTRTAEARALVTALRAADGVILASPGYHGSISGLVKNALDYTEDMVADARPYFDGLPVGCIGMANGWQAAVATMEALRQIAHALRGWPTPFGCAARVAPQLFDGERCTEAELEGQLRLVGRQVAMFAMARQAGGVEEGRRAVSA